MLILSILLALLPSLLLASSLTIYSSPVSVSDTPSPLLSIEYDPSTLTSSIKSYTPPTDLTSLPASSLHRIGLYDSASSHWTSVVTASSSFLPQYQKLVTIYIDDDGEAGHVSFSAVGRPNGSKVKKGAKDTESAQEVVVEIVRRSEGPKPVLNKPVVLNAEGRMDTKEPEKSFLQKYWWAIALFLLVQVVAGGGGGEK